MIKKNTNIILFNLITGEKIMGKVIDKINDSISGYYVVQNPIELYLEEDHGESQLFQFIDYPTMNDSDIIMIQPGTIVTQTVAATKLREHYFKALQNEPESQTDLIKMHDQIPDKIKH